MVGAGVQAVQLFTIHGQHNGIAGHTVGPGRVVREAWPVRNAWETDPELRSEMLGGVLWGGGGAGTEPGKFHVVGNGRDPDVFHPGDASGRAATREALGIARDAPLVVYAGSLGDQYCPGEMLQFMEALLARRSDARLLVLIVAAIVTPPDPGSQVILAIPLLLLFEGSLLIMRLTERRNADDPVAE